MKIIKTISNKTDTYLANITNKDLKKQIFSKREHSFSKYYLQKKIVEAYSEPFQTSKIKRFAKIVSD